MKSLLLLFSLVSVGAGASSDRRLPWVFLSQDTRGGDSNTRIAATISPPSDVSTAKFNFSLLQEGDGHEDDPDSLPGRFLRMQKGNRPKAIAALNATLEWRASTDVDTILSRPHPLYDLGKAIQKCYFLGRDNTGHVIFCQRPGFLDFELAEKANFTMDDLMYHYIYLLEYCWNILEPDPQQTMTNVLDLSHVSLTKTRQMLSFLKKFVAVMSAHYPQRSYKTLILNAPGWFGMIYRLISPLLRESTREKIEILGGSKQGETLRKYLGDDNVPAELLMGDPILNEAMSMEQAMRDFCLARLEEAGVEMKPMPSV